ncbi:hypothetical protein NQ317_006368 [Molorchus minor]|uniref:Protein LLP homolog n=1 Tax=Molorchus minor TaxID=1323400 RepID=A0ABQ9JQK4_9CUCU|nr:hypothetical protein NQ317_006368 [Molorchus minor]
MAKSLRSKWKRKCRAVKRDRYGKKELDRLKKTLGIEDTQNATNVPMKELAEVITFTTATDIKEKRRTEQKDEVVTSMDMEEIKSKCNTKTLRNEHGAYPVWVHPRKIKKISNKRKKVGKKKAKGKVTKKNK